MTPPRKSNAGTIAKTVIATSGITIVALITWIYYSGGLCNQIDANTATIERIAPMVYAANVDRERIRADMAELRPMVSELLRRNDRIENKLDALTDRMMQ